MSATPIAPPRRRSPICGARPVRPQWATTPILNPINAPAAPPHSSNQPNNPTPQPTPQPTPRLPHPLTPHNRLRTCSIAGTTTIRYKPSRPPNTAPLKNNPTRQSTGSTPHTLPGRHNPKSRPHLRTRSIQSLPHSPATRDRNQHNPPTLPLAPTRLNTTSRRQPTRQPQPSHHPSSHLPKPPPGPPPAD